MKNQGLRTDFNNARGLGHARLNDALTEAENYIEFLEGKEDRLTQVENTLNEIEASDMPGKDAFLDKFQGLKNA